MTYVALLTCIRPERSVGQERCIPDVFGKKLSPKLSDQNLFATVEKFKSYPSLVKKKDIFSV